MGGMVMLSEKDEISYLLERKLELMRLKDNSSCSTSSEVYSSEIKIIDEILRSKRK